MAGGISFEDYEDAIEIFQTLENSQNTVIVEITQLSHPKYFFPNLQSIIHTTKQFEEKIICVAKPLVGGNFRIAICDLNTKYVRLTNTKYKTAPSIESAFANFSE